MKAKETLTYYHDLFSGLNGDYKLSTTQQAELIHAIETMTRKYEQIEEILRRHNSLTDDCAVCIENLRRVVEDGEI